MQSLVFVSILCVNSEISLGLVEIYKLYGLDLMFV